MALTNKLSAIGDAIRVKTGTTELLTLDQMPSAISSITTASEPNLEELTVTANGIYIPTESDGYSKVTVEVEGGAEAPYTSLWENGTWEEISAVLTQYYNGEITDLSPYFRVGDVRDIHTDAIASYGGSSGSYTCASREARDMPWVIIGIQHDDLATTTEAGVTKSAFTVIPLYNYEGLSPWGTTTASTNSASNAADRNKYSTSQAKKWLNNIFYPAIEEDCKALIKTVTKLTRCNSDYGYNTLESSSEKVFLLSTIEVVNKTTDDGEQYEWFSSNGNGNIFNRIRAISEDKKNSFTFTTYALRSSNISKNSSTYYGYVYLITNTGSVSATNSPTSINAGACMGFCL